MSHSFSFIPPFFFFPLLYFHVSDLNLSTRPNTHSPGQRAVQSGTALWFGPEAQLTCTHFTLSHAQQSGHCMHFPAACPAPPAQPAHSCTPTSRLCCKPSHNRQLLSWAGVKIFQHPWLCHSAAIKNLMCLFSLLPLFSFFSRLCYPEAANCTEHCGCEDRAQKAPFVM